VPQCGVLIKIVMSAVIIAALFENTGFRINSLCKQQALFAVGPERPDQPWR
jgi:hypothetical protein